MSDETDAVLERVSNALSGADDDAVFRWEDNWLHASDIDYLLRCAESVKKLTRKKNDVELAFKTSQKHNGELMGRAIRAERERDSLLEQIVQRDGGKPR